MLDSDRSQSLFVFCELTRVSCPNRVEPTMLFFPKDLQVPLAQVDPQKSKSRKVTRQLGVRPST